MSVCFMHSSLIGLQVDLWYVVMVYMRPQLIFTRILRPQDECDQKLSTRWQRALHFIMEKSAEPQLYLDKIENLNLSYPGCPFALVRLGKAYLLLEDLHGALEQFEQALSLLSPVKDEKFALYVRSLRAYITVAKTPFCTISPMC